MDSNPRRPSHDECGTRTLTTQPPPTIVRLYLFEVFIYFLEMPAYLMLEPFLHFLQVFHSLEMQFIKGNLYILGLLL